MPEYHYNTTKSGKFDVLYRGLHDRTEPGLVERHGLTKSDVETQSFNATVA